MSTLAIPPKRVQLYRVLWDRWIIVLRILFDLGAGTHPVKWRAVADTLMVDKKTCQKYIAGLVRDGHIAPSGDGYMFTQAGMDVLLENTGGEFLPLGGLNTGENFSPLVVEVVNIDSESVKLTPTTPESGKIPGEKFSPLAKLILEHIPDLFDGSQLLTNGLPWSSGEFQDDLLLGWVAYAYDKRTSLNAPVGLIYSKLRMDDRPSLKYMQDPGQYLPETFMDAVGLLQKKCPRCDGVFQHLSEYHEHWKTCLYTPQADEAEDDEPTATVHVDPSVERRLDDGKTMSPGQAWQSVLGQLSIEMPRASYETWVRDSLAVHYQDNVLKVGVCNAYTRDWLENRLQSTVERLLVGILNREVTVEFVVAVETEVA